MKRASKVKKTTYEFEPLAEGFSQMEGPEFDAFRENVRRLGQQVPIIAVRRPGGVVRIIDGIRRFRVCESLGIPPRIKFWDGKGSVADLIASLNLHRRQLTDDQRAIHTARLYVPIAEESKSQRAAKGGAARASRIVGEQPSADVAESTDNRKALAREAGISEHKLRDAIRILRGSREAAQHVAERKLTLAQARRQVETTARRAELETLAKLSPPRSDQWELITGDFLAKAESLPNGKARLIFADPKYNLAIDYRGDGGKSDRMPEDEYLAWCRKWMAECARLLAPDGSMFILIDHTHTSDFGVMLREVGLRFRSIIVWYETFASYKAGNFTALRFIHYVTRDPRNFVFDAHAIKIPSWRNLNEKPGRQDPTGRLPAGLWGGPDDPLHRLVPNDKERIAPASDIPTQLPIELLHRIVRCASEPGDLVIDPFAGSGTTGASCILNGRRFWGTEIWPATAKLATTRLRAVTAQAAALAERKSA